MLTWFYEMKNLFTSEGTVDEALMQRVVKDSRARLERLRADKHTKPNQIVDLPIYISAEDYNKLNTATWREIVAQVLFKRRTAYAFVANRCYPGTPGGYHHYLHVGMTKLRQPELKRLSAGELYKEWVLPGHQKRKAAKL